MRCTVSQIYLIKYSTCLGQVHCPSLRVSQHCTHAIDIFHASSVGCLLACSGWNWFYPDHASQQHFFFRILPFNGYQRLPLTEVERWITGLFLVPRFRISEAEIPFLDKGPWRVQGRNYLYLYIEILTLRLLMSYIYGAPILDVSRSYTTTQHSR